MKNKTSSKKDARLHKKKGSCGCGKKCKCGKCKKGTCGHHNRGKGLSGIFLGAFVIAGLIVGLTNTKYKKIRNMDRFYRSLDKYNLSVAMFYSKDKQIARDMKKSIDRQIRMFKSLSRNKFFDDGDVLFARLNVSKSKLNPLVQQFNITEFPTYILFKGGQPAKDNMGSILQLTGPVSKKELDDFIDENFGDEIEQVIKQKEDERQMRAWERSVYGPRVTFGFGYGYPYYYGYPFGYYRYGWPYYGGYYGGYNGPGFGISFGI